MKSPLEASPPAKRPSDQAAPREAETGGMGSKLGRLNQRIDQLHSKYLMRQFNNTEQYANIIYEDQTNENRPTDMNESNDRPITSQEIKSAASSDYKQSVPEEPSSSGS